MRARISKPLKKGRDIFIVTQTFWLMNNKQKKWQSQSNTPLTAYHNLGISDTLFYLFFSLKLHILKQKQSSMNYVHSPNGVLFFDDT